MSRRSFALHSTLLPAMAALFLAMSLADAHAAIVRDGGFEQPVLTPGGAQVFSQGDYLPAPGQGWGVFGPVGPCVYVLEGGYSEPYNGVSAFNAAEGSNAVDLTGPGNTGPTTSLWENIGGLVTGVAYDLGFDVGRVTPASGPGGVYALPATISAQVDLGPVVDCTNAEFTPDRVNWKRFHYAFTAASESATVVFRNATPLACNYAGLDDIVVTRVDALAVPPPVPPGEPVLGAVTPNPARDALTIRFTLPVPGRVRVTLHDVTGRIVRELLDADRAAGTYAQSLPLRTPGGALPAPGLYFVDLQAEGRRNAQRIAIVR